jgi:hypothetical protein
MINEPDGDGNRTVPGRNTGGNTGSRQDSQIDAATKRRRLYTAVIVVAALAVIVSALT